ncbi:E3 ubiquitin-protein ligase RNF8-B [Trachymyrmex septentrionalis]|uniref:E3 ubiquitin-protein ligase CHFR n=1 Tax=Trachymyrmex septentrionalis TaxID=34720 RepID=A0A195F1R1_9HYME|nr:E3 ubiquitin-protein ligase RNF8-B [Trachymyrmex septentrionalis]
MEHSKRTLSDEEPKILEPVLIKTVTNERINIDKNEFKIGRARDNDEIILDVMISRRHCIFRCIGQNEWTLKDLSSSGTFVNGNTIGPGEVQNVRPGDTIQFSPNETFRYVFTLTEKEHCVKKARIDEKILDTVLVKQRTFAKNQELNTSGEIASTSECIFLNLNGDQFEVPQYEIIDTIDLTEINQNILETNINENILGKVSNIMDEQLTCAICSELFIKATTLNCAHTFCHHCINSWNKKQKNCPVCRKPVISMIRSLVLDNFIESMIDNLPTELKNRRKEIIQDRKVLTTKKRMY